MSKVSLSGMLLHNARNVARLAAATVALLAIASNPAAAADPSPAPVARIEPVVDTYFGEQVIDRYRWMENSADPDWLPFLEGQNLHARTVLDALPGRDALLARIQALSGGSSQTRKLQRAGNRLFYEQRPVGANHFKLMVRVGSKDRILVDPTALDTATGHVSLDWWAASPDGRRLVYGLSKDGSEDSTAQIMDTTTGTVLPERIADTQHASPQWLADGSGFFYNQLTGKVDTPERFLDSRARFHKLGTNSANDPVLMARGMDRAVAYDTIQAPYIETSVNSRYAVLALYDVRRESRLLIAPLKDVLAGKAHWTPVAEFDDEVTDVDLDGDQLYLLANKGHPRGRVLKLSALAPKLGTAKEVVGETTLVLQGFARAKDGLYLRSMDGGLARLQRLDHPHRLVDIALPFDGTLSALEADVAAKYTAPAHLAIGGRSAGGITVGRALTERPDLYAAVVSGVGWHDPLRYVAEQNGYAEEPEWGAIRDETGYRALKSIDSYQAVVDGTRYPAVLLTTGVTDPRVAPFHPAKMAARLLAATASANPILLRVDFDAGHGMGSTRAQQDDEAADTYAFILSQTKGGK